MRSYTSRGYYSGFALVLHSFALALVHVRAYLTLADLALKEAQVVLTIQCRNANQPHQRVAGRAWVVNGLSWGHEFLLMGTGAELDRALFITDA
jgi:hypothetical protein